jgi:hypothetical protein
LLIQLAWMQNSSSKGWWSESTLSSTRCNFLGRYVADSFSSVAVGVAGDGIGVKSSDFTAMASQGAKNLECDDAGDALGTTIAIGPLHCHLDSCPERSEVKGGSVVALCVPRDNELIVATAQNGSRNTLNNSFLPLRELNSSSGRR